MKRTVLVLSTMLVVCVAVFAMLVLRPVRKVKAGRGCADASLDGNYALVMPGYYYVSSDQYLYELDYSMLATFDGQGHFSGSSPNGVELGTALPGSGTSFTGATYTVNQDCTVTITIPAGLNLAFFFDSQVDFNGVLGDTGGDEVTGTAYYSTASGNSWAGTFDAQKLEEGKWNFFD
jgi:hypothetical protein